MLVLKTKAFYKVIMRFIFVIKIKSLNQIILRHVLRIFKLSLKEY